MINYQQPQGQQYQQRQVLANGAVRAPPATSLMDIYRKRMLQRQQMPGQRVGWAGMTQAPGGYNQAVAYRQPGSSVTSAYNQKPISGSFTNTMRDVTNSEASMANAAAAAAKYQQPQSPVSSYYQQLQQPQSLAAITQPYTTKPVPSISSFYSGVNAEPLRTTQPVQGAVAQPLTAGSVGGLYGPVNAESIGTLQDQMRNAELQSQLMARRRY